ncbi:arsenosugar biosynthesis radical SAM (seleno)protein ArsS [Polycyclovorans algicola]|uniref:arsenosugar biosynthesis radical SAM (seleno)protein ArsS n=1 Tax=Polycyclovorans algicola TaxID=616992 RepID=UPI0004A73F1B|nr:arsenosugar biosynthesis radical SAM (seleno)protein ArsS [Polycyclovorans algicola]
MNMVLDIPVVTEALPPDLDRRHDFAARLRDIGLRLDATGLGTLQVNLTKLCNQACRHCHVDASPARTEALPADDIDRLLALLEARPGIAALDLTGGAPELHPDFERLVIGARALGRQVMVRHNLTVTFDGNPQTGQNMGHLPDFFAAHGVEVICSLPYYQALFTDRQRGSGVFKKSIAGLQRLNALGYGQPDSGRVLNLVYNPVGPFLPAAQAGLEADYKRELQARYGIVFNQLFTITNIPINRFALHLRKSGQLDAYMDKLSGAFNPEAARGVMCRDMISVGADGQLYDCDFNQQIDLPIIDDSGAPMTLRTLDAEALLRRDIRVGAHCFACTAGAGSSCGGSTT